MAYGSNYGNADSGLDYTAADLGMDSSAPQEVVLGAVSLGDFGFDADQTERENGFRDVPPGDHLLIIGDVVVKPEQSVKVLVDGRVARYSAFPAQVRYHLPNDKRATVTDFFMLPPATPQEMAAYLKGVPEDKPDRTPGFDGNKFLHFADRAGLIDKATKSLNATGQRPSTWKGRAIGATVTAGRGTYVNKDGQTVARQNQIKMFSYKPATAATAANVAAHPGQPNAPAMSRQPMAAPQPSTSVDDVLANI